MKRETVKARHDWTSKVEGVGFTYHTLGKSPGDDPDAEGVYWCEDAAYRFTTEEVDVIEAATEELHQLCLNAVDHVVRNPDLMDRFQIPNDYRPFVIKSWNRRDPYVMGRFDLAFDPETKAVKMLEYNADTPTLVIETAVVQWFWMQDVKPYADQFNSLHEKLIERYQHLKEVMPRNAVLHFSSLKDFPEEYQHTLYFQDLAQQAGLKTEYCPIEEIGWHEKKGVFVDFKDHPIKFWSKLYPWEWLAQEQFGPMLLKDEIGCIEPVWKMLLSNKAILPILWSLYPNHPLLLPAYFEEDNPLMKGAYIAKPILSREGANIKLVRPGQKDVATGGAYHSYPVIYQGVANLRPFNDEHHVVIGSWTVGEKAAGMIIRESTSPIVINSSRVVPHYFV